MKTQAMMALLLTAGIAMAQNNGQQRGSGQSGADFVKRLDKDGDGKVSQSEFDGPSEHFSQFDADGDGYLSESEAPTAPPQQGQRGNQQRQQRGGQKGQRGGAESGADFVKRLDKDGDSKVSSDEFDGPANLFTQLDKDGDGYLSESEAPSGPSQGQRGRR